MTATFISIFDSPKF